MAVSSGLCSCLYIRMVAASWLRLMTVSFATQSSMPDSYIPGRADGGAIDAEMQNGNVDLEI